MMNEEILNHAEIIEFNSSMNFIQNRIYVLESVGSTNEFIFNLEEIISGMVVVAKTQSSGRGRIGKTWHSADGGLWFSLGIDPDEIMNVNSAKPGQSQRIKGINLASALAIVRALEKINLRNVKIKWPNDVYLKDHKICGILTQSRFDVDNNRIVIGFGLNVNQKSSDFPADLQKKAGSLLSLTGKQHNILDILEKILVEFDQLLHEILLNGINDLCNEINTHSLLNKHKVKLKHGSDVYVGEVVKIDEDGSLLMRVTEKDAQLFEKSDKGEIEDLMNFYAGEIIEF